MNSSCCHSVLVRLRSSIFSDWIRYTLLKIVQTVNCVSLETKDAYNCVSSGYFTYRRTVVCKKVRGPRTDPCGTAHSSGTGCDDDSTGQAILLEWKTNNFQGLFYVGEY